MATSFSRLDRPSIRKLKPGEKLTEKGITVTRLPDGDLNYEINIMVRGRRVHRIVGRASSGVTRTTCETIIEKEKTEARTERFGLPAPNKRVVPTLAKAADDYLARMVESGGRDLYSI